MISAGIKYTNKLYSFELLYQRREDGSHQFFRMTVPKLTFSQKAAKSVGTIELQLQSSPVFVSLIIVTFIVFCAALALNFLASEPTLIEGLFLHGIANVSAEFPLNITPANWAFSIWSIIYALQLVWNIYSVGLVCRSTTEGPAYLNPIILSPAYFIFFNLSSAFNIGWLFLWDRYLFLASFIFIACIALSLFLSLAIASSRFVMFKDTLVNQGRNNEIPILLVAVINGLAMYATWTVIASVINLGVVFTYKWSQPITNENSSVICISILAFFAVIYIALDVTVFERYTRYSLSPYAVVIWGLAAIVSRNYDPNNVSSIISAVLLGAVSLAFVIKLGITFYNYSNVKYRYTQMKDGIKHPL